MTGLPSTPWLVLIGVLTGLLFWAFFGWWRATTRMARGNRARQRVARKGESDAERLLESQGFTVLDRQLAHRWTLEVDGEDREVLCRVDLLVEKDGEVFVADVKTGDQAPRPHQPATRRQLLEYLLAFEADGALVVDMRRRQVRSVSFPGLLEV